MDTSIRLSSDFPFIIVLANGHYPRFGRETRNVSLQLLVGFTRLSSDFISIVDCTMFSGWLIESLMFVGNIYFFDQAKVERRQKVVQIMSKQVLIQM